MYMYNRLAASDGKGVAYYPPVGVMAISVAGSCVGQQAESC